MKPEPRLNQMRITQQGYDGNVSFLTDGREGAAEFHLAEKDLKIGFKTGQAVNPLERGHLAFRTDDIAGFKKRLEEKGIPYSDFGAWAMKGWEQSFCYDPAGNIIEVLAWRDVAVASSSTRRMRYATATTQARVVRTRATTVGEAPSQVPARTRSGQPGGKASLHGSLPAEV